MTPRAGSMALLATMLPWVHAGDLVKGLNPSFPVTYIQSGFTTNDPPAWFYRTPEQKRLRVEGIAQFFDGAEVLNLNVDTTAGRRDVRELSRAMQAVSRARGKLFVGFWSFPRLPGFFRPADVQAQPDGYRAWSLKADGSPWRRLPSLPEENESKIKFTGEMLDLANPEAVAALLANIRRCFRWDGPEGQCVGPLTGYIVLNECMLCSNWESVWSKHEKEHDVASPDTVMRLGRKTHRQLFVDDDPRYSYFNPPKRAIPLFSRRARDSFVEFARRRGHVFSVLPADRNEFVDDDAAVSLPEWIRFISPAKEEHWAIWREWVTECWTSFIERVAREWCLAQQSNPWFKGVIYFQLPMWYSLPTSSREPISYTYVDRHGQPVTETVVMADYPEYDVLNPVVMGTDMDRLMRSPWFAGMVHETTKSIPVHVSRALSKADYDAAVEAQTRFRHYFMAQGALARRACRRNGKLFGAFARSQTFKNSEPLDATGFEHAFRHVIDPLRPDIIATIGPWFADHDKLDPKYQPVLRGTKGFLEDVWRQTMARYRSSYRRATPE